MFERYWTQLRWAIRLPCFWIVYWYFSGELQSPPTSGQILRLAIYAYVGLLLDVRRLFGWKHELFGLNLLHMIIMSVFAATDGLWFISVFMFLALTAPFQLRWRQTRGDETVRAALYEVYVRPFLEPELEDSDWYS